MDLIGKSVKHKVFGKGVIVDYNDGRIAMEFAKGKKIFTYPDAFENFLSTDDAELSSKVVADLKLKNEEVLQIQSEKEEKIALEEAQKAEIKVKKPRAKAKSYPRANIAFRCRYAEGGQSANQIPKEWRSLAGVVKSGVNEGKVTKLHQVQMNSLCALTARDAGTDESERFIFTVFMINEAIDATTKESYITTDSKYRISLTPTEARQMLFWKYHASANNNGVPNWSSGHYLYFGDGQAVQILKDIVKAKIGTEEELFAVEFLYYFCKVNKIDVNSINI